MPIVISYDSKDGGDNRKAMIKFLYDAGATNIKLVLKTTIQFNSPLNFEEYWTPLFKSLDEDYSYYACKVWKSIDKEPYYTHSIVNREKLKEFKDLYKEVRDESIYLDPKVFIFG